MEHQEAVELIAVAVADSGPVWADFGAGSGTFTRALQALLPLGSRIYAVDRDPGAVAGLGKLGEGVMAIRADFTQHVVLPDATLDGMLFANALHFTRAAEGVLGRLVKLLRPGGRVVIVEYDRRAASRWVPYPIALSRWPVLANAVGLENSRVTARRPSAYAGELYVGVAERPEG